VKSGRLVKTLPLVVSLVVAAPFAQAEDARQPGDTFRDCADCGEMVVVPPGEFDMGAADMASEAPVHRVTIAKPFAIGRREVSFAEWDACVAAGPCKYAPGDHGWGRGARPAIDLSWDDLAPFVGWLSQKAGQSYRLPSEAEWEYSARAGTVSSYWWGKDVGTARAKCQDCGGTPGAQTVPTGSFRPNAFGLYDTSGNAAEWVQDCWNPNYRGAPTDGSAWAKGDCTLRVLRGGYFASKSNAIRSGARFRYDEDVRFYGNGFRVARDLK
jgi:formylglycine-generating enzyme required for sulfatase activity